MTVPLQLRVGRVEREDEKWDKTKWEHMHKWNRRCGQKGVLPKSKEEEWGIVMDSYMR